MFNQGTLFQTRAPSPLPVNLLNTALITAIFFIIAVQAFRATGAWWQLVWPFIPFILVYLIIQRFYGVRTWIKRRKRHMHPGQFDYSLCYRQSRRKDMATEIPLVQLGEVTRWDFNEPWWETVFRSNQYETGVTTLTQPGYQGPGIRLVWQDFPARGESRIIILPAPAADELIEQLQALRGAG